MVRSSAAEEDSTAARTKGHRWRGSRRRCTADSSNSPRGHCRNEGRQKMAIDGECHNIVEVVVERLCPASLAGGSSRKRPLDIAVDKAVRIPGSDGNRMGWRWSVTTNSALAEESRGGAVAEVESESEREEKKVDEAY
jgi:hypothetical protein